jgi:uncharacterized membrane-anchored protein
MHHDYLITPQHTLHQIAQGTPEILAATGQSMLINEQHVVFEASVEMRLETQLNYDRVVVAVDVCIDTVQALEHVADERGERLGEGYANARREHGLVVDVRLYPGHKMLDILWSRHLGGLLVSLRVLPQVFESRWC